MPSFKDELFAKLMDPKRLKPYKKNSLNPVWSYLKKLNGGVDPVSLDFLLNVPVVTNYLNTYAVATQRSIVYVIFNVLREFERKDLLEAWKEKIESVKQGEGLVPKGEMTEKQKEAYASVKTDEKNAWDTLVGKVEENTASAQPSSLAYAVPPLYILFPPRRNIDNTEMVIATDETDITDQSRNYLAIQEIKGKIGMMFIFNQYKTSGTYRQQSFELPDDLVEVLMKYIKARGKKDGDYLLTHEGHSDKLRSDDITNVLHKVFGTHIGTQMLRHMFLDKYNTPDRRAVIEEMMGDAVKMAHSIMTQQDTYVKR